MNMAHSFAKSFIDASKSDYKILTQYSTLKLADSQAVSIEDRGYMVSWKFEDGSELSINRDMVYVDTRYFPQYN